MCTPNLAGLCRPGDDETVEFAIIVNEAVESGEESGLPQEDPPGGLMPHVDGPLALWVQLQLESVNDRVSAVEAEATEARKASEKAQSHIEALEIRIAELTQNQSYREDKSSTVPPKIDDVPEDLDEVNFDDDLQAPENDRSSRRSSLSRSHIHSEAREILEAGGPSTEYALAESSWDVALLIGTEEIGFMGSCVLIFLTVMNVTVQITFCLLVLYNVVEEGFSDEVLTGLENWRVLMHMQEKYTPVGTVVSRVCSGDAALDTSTSQADMLGLVLAYLPALNPDVSTSDVQFYLSGWVMCLLALLCWLLTCFTEVFKALDFVCACGQVYKRNYHVKSNLKVVDGQLTLDAIGLGRLCAMVFVTLLRIGIACFLLFVGSEFLIHTPSMADLLLNAVALEFVMALDEICYVALAPDLVRDLLACIAPLSIRPWPACKGADLRSGSVPFVLMAVLVGMYFTLQGVITNLEDAHRIMCGGDLDFTFQNDAMGIQHVSYVSGFDPKKTLAILTDTQRGSVAQLIDQAQPSALTGAIWSYPIKGEKWYEQANDIFKQRGVGCHDLLDDSANIAVAGASASNTATKRLAADNQWKVWSYYLQEQLQTLKEACSELEVQSAGCKLVTKTPSTPITHCKDIKDFCMSTDPKLQTMMRFTRVLCPVTCGCNSLIRGSYAVTVEKDDFICPEVCLANLDSTEAQQTKCVDATPDGDPVRWASVVAWLGEVVRKNASSTVLADFRQRQCPALVRQSAESGNSTNATADYSSFCQVGQYAGPNTFPVTSQSVKVFSYLCPESCGCADKDQIGSGIVCPTPCSKYVLITGMVTMSILDAEKFTTEASNFEFLQAAVALTHGLAANLVRLSLLCQSCLFSNQFSFPPSEGKGGSGNPNGACECSGQGYSPDLPDYGSTCDNDDGYIPWCYVSFGICSDQIAEEEKYYSEVVCQAAVSRNISVEYYITVPPGNLQNSGNVATSAQDLTVAQLTTAINESAVEAVSAGTLQQEWTAAGTLQVSDMAAPVVRESADVMTIMAFGN